jgi:predicted Fe-Mo cluster-binding NifX family protein
MRIAVAAITMDIDSEVAKHGARAPCYLVFDDRGVLSESINNPYSRVDRAAAPQVSALLADRGITMVAAGDFGPRFVAELEQRGIDIARRSGPVSDVVQQLID